MMILKNWVFYAPLHVSCCSEPSAECRLHSAQWHHIRLSIYLSHNCYCILETTKYIITLLTAF